MNKHKINFKIIPKTKGVTKNRNFSKIDFNEPLPQSLLNI